MRHNLNWYADITDVNLCLAIAYYNFNCGRYTEVDKYGGQLSRNRDGVLEAEIPTTPAKKFKLQIRNTCNYTYTLDIIRSYLWRKLFGVRTILVHRKDNLKAFSFIVDGAPFIDVLFSDNVITVFKGGVDTTYTVEYTDDDPFKYTIVRDPYDAVVMRLTKMPTSAKIEIPMRGIGDTPQELPLIRMYSTGTL